MSSFDYVRPSGIWANEMVPGASDYQRWDVTQSKILDGTSGTSRAPTSPIILGGAGVQMFGGATLLTGGMRTQTGGRIILGTHDVPALSPPRTRTIRYPLLCARPATINQLDAFELLTSAGGVNYYAFPDAYLAAVPPSGGCGVLPAGLAVSGAAAAAMYIPIPGEYLHNSSNSPFTVDGDLASIAVTFRLLARPTGTPATAIPRPPTISIYDEAGPVSSAPPVGYEQLLTAGSVICPWNANAAVTAGQYIVPVGGAVFSWANADVYWRATTTGNMAASIPTFNRTPGSVTIDNTVHWLCIGRNGYFNPPDVATMFAGGSPQTVGLDFDLALSQGINTTNHDYRLVLRAPLDPLTGLAVPIIWHSVAFTFSNIVSMAWSS